MTDTLAQTASDNKPKLLIVDDQPNNLYALRRILGFMEITVLEAGSGREALERAMQHDFFLILLDVQMPNMDGFDVARILRGYSRHEHTPIIFITAISKDETFVLEGYDSGGVDYLIKPIISSILKYKVKIFLDIYLYQKEIEKKEQEIRRLKSFIPVCRTCRSVNREPESWDMIEAYVHNHPETSVSDYVCDKCMDKILDDEDTE